MPSAASVAATQRTIAGVILAGGLSERMESDLPKQLLPFGTTTMLGHVVATAEATSLSPIVVVTGHNSEAVQAAVTPRRARFAYNPDYSDGNLTSLRVGLTAAGECDAVMLLLGDNPEVGSDVIETVGDKWHESAPFAAVASFNGEISHPFVLSRRAVELVQTLSGPKPLWAWLRDEHVDEVLEVPFDRTAPRDVNTMADYEAMLERLGRAGRS